MPISVRVTRGLLTAAGEREIVPRIGRALLEAHGLADNSFMQSSVIGHVQVVEETASFVGGAPQSLALIELNLPAIALRERAVQQQFVERVTTLVDELKAGSHPRARTFVHVSHGIDGGWGIAGKAYTSADLGEAIAAAAG